MSCHHYPILGCFYYLSWRHVPHMWCWLWLFLSPIVYKLVGQIMIWLYSVGALRICEGISLSLQWYVYKYSNVKCINLIGFSQLECGWSSDSCCRIDAIKHKDLSRYWFDIEVRSGCWDIDCGKILQWVLVFKK